MTDREGRLTAEGIRDGLAQVIFLNTGGSANTWAVMLDDFKEKWRTTADAAMKWCRDHDATANTDGVGEEEVESALAALNKECLYIGHSPSTRKNFELAASTIRRLSLLLSEARGENAALMEILNKIPEMQKHGRV